MSKRKVLLLGAAAVAVGAVWLRSSSGATCPRSKALAARATPVIGPNGPITLVDKKVPVPVTLVERRRLTHDTDLFRFSLPTPDHVLGLPTGQHVHLQTPERANCKKLVRVYTPVSSDNDKGVMDVVIKLYRPNAEAGFPEGGKMSKVLDALKPGDKIDARGPTGRFFYRGNGKLAFKKDKKDPEPSVFHDVNKIIMLAGGSGITPMLQLIKHVVNDPTDDTKLELLFANKSEEDIMLRDQLEALAAKHPDQLKIWYTVDKAPAGWTYSQGFISADMIRQHLSPAAADTFVFLCGPKPMIQYACAPALKALGFPEDHIHKF